MKGGKEKRREGGKRGGRREREEGEKEEGKGVPSARDFLPCLYTVSPCLSSSSLPVIPIRTQSHPLSLLDSKLYQQPEQAVPM